MMNGDFSKVARSCLDDFQPFGEACWVPRVNIHQPHAARLVEFGWGSVRAEELELRVDQHVFSIERAWRDFACLERHHPRKISESRFQRSVDFQLT